MYFFLKYISILQIQNLIKTYEFQVKRDVKKATGKEQEEDLGEKEKGEKEKVEKEKDGEMCGDNDNDCKYLNDFEVMRTKRLTFLNSEQKFFVFNGMYVNYELCI